MRQVWLGFKGDGYGHKEVVSAYATEALADEAVNRKEADWQECVMVEEGPFGGLPEHTVVTSTKTFQIQGPAAPQPGQAKLENKGDASIIGKEGEE